MTKAAFLDRRYLELYSGEEHRPVREYVDRHRNCEDIAMSLLVFNATRNTKAEGAGSRVSWLRAAEGRGGRVVLDLGRNFFR